MIATAVREQGQVTLPQEIREAAGIEAGDQVEWSFQQGEIRGRKLVRQPEPKTVVAKLVKRGKHLVFEAKGLSISPDAIARAVREERDSR